MLLTVPNSICSNFCTQNNVVPDAAPKARVSAGRKHGHDRAQHGHRVGTQPAARARAARAAGRRRAGQHMTHVTCHKTTYRHTPHVARNMFGHMPHVTRHILHVT
jgi:hypothetical protein